MEKSTYVLPFTITLNINCNYCKKLLATEPINTRIIKTRGLHKKLRLNGAVRKDKKVFCSFKCQDRYFKDEKIL